jgi:hypothetical protein
MGTPSDPWMPLERRNKEKNIERKAREMGNTWF